LQIGTYVSSPEYLQLATLLLDSLKKCNSTSQLTFVVPEDLSAYLPSVNTRIQPCTIPSKHQFFPFYDKVVAAAAFEKEHSEPFLWIDLDSFFLQNPDSFALSCALGVNPVDHKNIGIPRGNPITPLWQHVLQTAQYSDTEFSMKVVSTGISKESIYPYYNMGMVFHNTDIPIFQSTQTLLEDLLEDAALNEILAQAYIHRVFLHQVVFSILVEKLFTSDQISRLPEGWNYPLHLHHQNSTPPELTLLKSVRYDTFFQKNPVPSCWSSWLGEQRPDLTLRWYYE